MYDGGKIILGLAIAIVLLTFPIWANFGKAAPAPPQPVLAANAQAAGYCVEPKAKMRTTHMQILDNWRNSVVRDGHRYEIVEPGAPEVEMIVIDTIRNQFEGSVVEMPPFGKVRDWLDKGEAEKLLVTVSPHQKYFDMSLQNTCMQCHTSKKEFCDQCHNYTNVTPFCWDCHVEPEEKQ